MVHLKILKSLHKDNKQLYYNFDKINNTIALYVCMYVYKYIHVYNVLIVKKFISFNHLLQFLAKENAILRHIQ